MGALPTDDELIRLAGYNPKYARVITTARLGDTAAVLIDSNGDGRLIDFQGMWVDPAGKWWAGISAGAGSYGEGPLTEDVDYQYECVSGPEGEGWRITLSPGK
ncbi:MAG: hypothetical protein ACJ735_00260 [Actinomycetes bacterium]